MRLVALMGGEIGVRSEQGVGSMFWFSARFGVATAAPSRRTALSHLQGQRVLVVDDNATNRKVLEKQLQAVGCIPVVVDSAAQATLELTKAHQAGTPFPVALLDHQMPETGGEELGRMILANPQWRETTRLALLTSSGHRDNRAHFAELGFAAYLQKPVMQRALNDCLMIVLAAPAEAWYLQTQPIVTEDDLRALPGREQRRVLVAEDQPVNQKVARRIVEKIGYMVDVVNNGSEAVKAWETGRYHLILMDCQMPEIDGYEATRIIRAREAAQNKSPIPIVALTADAVVGTDQRCKAAGMDDYVTKPVDRMDLERILDRFLMAAPASARELESF